MTDVVVACDKGEEDEKYTYDDYYRKNVRRGLTILEIFTSQTDRDTFWARKGLEKFFDLTRDFIQLNLGSIKELSLLGFKSMQEQQKIYKNIF